MNLPPTAPPTAPPPCRFISWNSVHRLCRELARAVRDSGFRPDIVVAIGRGGYAPARLVCDCLHLGQLTGIKVEHYAATRKRREAVIRYPLNADIRGLDVLLVDDVNDSGDTLAVAVDYLRGFAPKRLRTAVLHEKALTRFAADLCARRLNTWRWLVYPWAVVEDVNSFLRALAPPATSPEEARRRLLEEHGLRIPLRALRDALEFPEAAPATEMPEG